VAAHDFRLDHGLSERRCPAPPPLLPATVLALPLLLCCEQRSCAAALTSEPRGASHVPASSKGAVADGRVAPQADVVHVSYGDFPSFGLGVCNSIAVLQKLLHDVYKPLEPATFKPSARCT
jgi:hypothetical protein